MYREFNLDVSPSVNGGYYVEAYKEGIDRIILGYGETVKKAEADAKKNIDEYLDLFGE